VKKVMSEEPDRWQVLGDHAMPIDNVNRPAHYQSLSGIECIDAIQAVVERLDGFEAVCTANVVKYVWRWKDKNGVEDLRKAQWYLSRLIKTLTECPPAG